MYETTSILNEFSLPIMLLDNVKTLDNQIITDLECISSKDETTDAMYNYIFEPNTVFSKTLLSHWAKHYTTNTQFIKDSIQLYKNYKPITPLILDDTIEKTWKSIKNDNVFCSQQLKNSIDR